MTPEELDAVWDQRRTENITTLAWIANAHLDSAEFTDIDGRGADDYHYLCRAQWCVHKIELLKMMVTNTDIKRQVVPRPLRDGEVPTTRGVMADWEEAPRGRCHDPFCTRNHGWIEDHQMRWCPGV